MFLLSRKISVGYGFLLLWIIMLQSDLPISRACIEDERISLLDFKAGLNLSSGRLSSWRGFNCCQWEGVGCDYRTSHVIHLDLSNRPHAYSQELSGEIRPSLFNLEHLQQLDLSWNDFKGISIPPQLSKLHRLTFLSLKSAGFGGEVPLELGNMSRLRHLDISAQYYSNTLNSSKFDVWARNLRSLEFLGMDDVNLTMASEKWGEALSGHASLREIHLFDCGLSGNIPDLSNLSSLSHLHIGYNSFPFELPPWFENVSSLVSLDLEGCRLNGYIPSNFMPRSKLNNLVLSFNHDLKGNLSFILNYSSSLVVLSLDGCNLGGEIPASIADFSKLETMDLSYNSFEGGIPSSFGSLSSLATLDLSVNQLTGQIPTSLCQLLVLSKLDLSHNQLSGTIPESISMLASIEVLSLNYNYLTGKIPPSLCELLVLSELHLGHNQLSGTIPDSISKLASLEVLTVPSNRLRGNISLPMFDNLTRLQGLDLSENQFTIAISTSWVPQFGHLVYLGLRSCNIEGDFPPFFSQQYQLEYLDLSSNYIVGNLPSWLWDLPYLDMLNLSYNQLEGSLPRKISHNFSMVDLKENKLYGSLPPLDFVKFMLDLSGNKFNGSIPATIGTIFLSLSGNNLTGKIPSSICTDSNELGLLDLSNNKLTGMIPASIGLCSRLNVLKLAQNVLQGEIPEELGNLQTLSTLNLNGNRLEGIIPLSISNCTGLKVFDLGNNKFEGSIPVWIEKLTHLKILSLTSNNFRSTIPTQLMRLHNLQILDLSNNSLSGSIPQNLSKLYAMANQSQIIEVEDKFHGEVMADLYMESSYEYKYEDEITVWIKGRALTYGRIYNVHKFMDLSGNNLSGTIPSELGFLQGLISLNISNNNLSSSIPESLGAMAQLESLDLSQNKLSGEIPFQLSNITFLEVLNLSNNMLSGLIPQGKQFLTFEASSFLGNPNLHGFPLENRTKLCGAGCKENQTEWNNTANNDANVMDKWWAVGMGLSYGIGFATIIAVLCFHIEWRDVCFNWMDNFIYHLCEH